MDYLEQNYGYLFSTDLGILEQSEPPIDLFQQYYSNPLDLNDIQKQELADFSFSILTLLEGNNTNDKAGIDYISKFLRHYCPSGNNIAQLNDEGRQSILSLFEVNSEVVKKAIEASNCTTR